MIAIYVILLLSYIVVGFYTSSIAYGRLSDPKRSCGIKRLDAAVALTSFGLVWPLGALFILAKCLVDLWLERAEGYK